jgi:hypothetical protein
VNLYKDNGYKSRTEYLKSLAEEFNISVSEVKMISELIGKEEDFDGLVSEIQLYLLTK